MRRTAAVPMIVVAMAVAIQATLAFWLKRDYPFFILLSSKVGALQSTITLTLSASAM
jgi:hypothetical protein